MATFILVHGTFAKEAHWPLLQDGISDIAVTLNEQAHFEQVRWSGRNHTSARERAAGEISRIIEAARTSKPDEKLFLIGHSHGGSALAYFLKAYPNAAAYVAGSAFLSTPFVAIRPRLNAARQLAILALFLFLVWMAVTVALLVEFGANGLALYAIGVSAFAYSGLIFGLVTSTFGKNVITNAVRRQTADIPAGNFLFMRCSGDEAAAALSAAQFLVWASAKFSRLTDLYLRPLYRLPIPAAFMYGGLMAFLIFLALSLALPALATLIGLGFKLGTLFIGAFFFLMSYDFWEAVVGIVVAFASIAASFIFLATLAGTVFFFTAQALCSWSFGWTGFWTGMLVEFAIEPLPYGDHHLILIDWSSASSGPDMVHSWAYSHPVAIQGVKDWIATVIARESGLSNNAAVPTNTERPQPTGCRDQAGA